MIDQRNVQFVSSEKFEMIRQTFGLFSLLACFALLVYALSMITGISTTEEKKSGGVVFGTTASRDKNVEISKLDHLQQQIENDLVHMTGEGDGDDDQIVKGLISPRQPCTITVNKLETFVFRTNIPPNTSPEPIRIYLSKGRRLEDTLEGERQDFKDLRELGRLTIATGMHDWMILWIPRLSDGISVDGGDDYFLTFKRVSWWGWRKEVLYETEYIRVLPDNAHLKQGQDADGDLFMIQQ
jgi:hypothetical protein